MDLAYKMQLIALDNDFYRRQAAEFSASRRTSWAGWENIPLWEQIQVLDVAAGNLRFAQFLRTKLDKFSYLGIDASRPLLQSSQLPESSWQVIDILSAYSQDQDWREALPVAQYDLVLVNAFIHHVPGVAWRRRLIEDCWQLVAPGGRLVVSFWQFATGLKHLIVQDLGDGDYLLTWGGSNKPARFAHDFSDQAGHQNDEITALSSLIAAKGGQIEADYLADRYNRYLIWHRG